jgi:tetratricopeptide (TPR) repeat protein
VPNHIPALMRLIEICVDGGLEATMHSAQVQLADAYIGAGLAAEARFLAEDLVAREPWERANIERFRKALVLMGEPDPDALIADRLSGQSPFISTDLSLGSGDLPAFAENPDGPEPATAHSPEPLSSAPVSPDPATRQASDLDSQFELDSSAIAFDSIELSEFGTALSSRHELDNDGIELNLGDVERQAADDMEGLFAQSPGSAMDVAERAYKQGLTLYHLGQIDDCIPALETASRAPRLRFEAASLLARIFRDRQIVEKEIEWLERAAQAPAPTPEEGYLLLYELAVALESSGAVARALAVCLELQANAADYRDVAVRVDRLAKVQAGG